VYGVTIDSIVPQYLAKESGKSTTVTFTILPDTDYVPKSVTLTAGDKSWTLAGITGGGTYTVDLIEGTDLTEVNNYSVTITVDGATSNVKTETNFSKLIDRMYYLAVKPLTQIHCFNL